MKRTDYIILALLLCFGMGARADNVVSIGSVEGAPGEEVTVSVGLTNTDALSSLQLSIPWDENLTLVEGSAQVGSRCAGHAANVGVKDGVLQVVVYSLSMQTIAPGSGDVATFRIKLAGEPVSITLQSTKTVLTDGNGNTVNGSCQSGTATIRCAKAQFDTDEIDFGRVPIRSTYTREVAVTNVGNANLVVSSLEFSDVNVFSSTTQLPKTITPGSTANINVTFAPTERGAIERQLRIVSNSSTRNRAIKLKALPYAVNELHIGDASGISDEEVTISMRMNNMDDISGYQIEFQLPNSLQYVDGSFAVNDNRKQDHTGAASIVDGTLRLLAYSPSGKPLKGNDGEIGTFRVKLVGSNSVYLEPVKTVLSATINNKVENVVSDVYGGQVSIQYPAISTDGEIDFGAVSVTEECKRTFSINNYGSAPLTISRIVFNNEYLSVEEAMPLVIQSWQSSNVTVVYSSTEQTAFEAKMQIYSNDPDRRLHEVNVRGSRFAPNYLSMQIPDVFEDETVKMNLSVNTYDDVTGLQFDMEYPNSVYEPFDDNIYLAERAKRMTVSSRQMSPNTIRYVCYFLGGGGIAAGEGEVMSIGLKPVAEVTPVGTYTVSIKNVKLGTAELADKYAGSDVSGTFQVKKHNPVTITAKSYTRLYGDANPTFEYTSEGAAVVGQPEFSCEATVTSPVGVYPIHITKGSVTNEEDTYVDGTLTITQAPLTIAAGTYTKKQGEENPEFVLSYEGFKNNETKDVLTKQAKVVCEAIASSAPGEYSVTVSGAEAQNYEISYVSGKLIVTNADPVTVTANSYTIVYGDAIPEFGYTSTGATLDGTPTISCEATSASPVGTYPIVISKGSVTNYNDSYVNGTLTITKAPLTIAAGTYTKKQYDPMPEFVVSYEGFKNNETKDVLTKQPTVNCEANEDSAPGVYDVVVSGAEAENYEIKYVAGKLTVTEPDSYTLTYIVDGEVYQSFTIKYRESIVPLEAPTKEGYTFSGWSEIPATMPAHDVEVTGSFSVNSYTLTYKVDGEVYKTTTVVYGTALTPEAEPTKEGYTFSGWSEIPATMPAHDVEVTGTFSVNSYTLTYKVDGEVYKTTTVVFGTALTPEAEPTKEGYTFSGWSEIPATMPAHDVEVTGTFSVNSYTLTYKVDGEVYKTSTVVFGTALTPEAEPTKEGYTFSGWSEIPATMPAHDVEVTGTFTVNKYTVTFMYGDEVLTTIEVEYGAEIPLPESLDSDRYILIEWLDVPETMPAHDVVIYADFVDGISRIAEDSECQIYDQQGKCLSRLVRGINIIRYSDGTTKKVLIK
ncbi:MAG: InlB B-repeat-containing protein [Bacteroidaceae bacterium]|nr:InlB B-repeat-containing protein [Bacteroidaceae bacterium]